MIRISVIIIALLQAYTACSQSYKFRKYIELDGLNNRFVYTIDQDELGNLLVGTGEGLFLYDGFTFTEVSEVSGITENFFTCSFRSSDSTIWYGHNQGLLTQYKQGKFEHFDLSIYTQSRINGIYEDSKHNLWVLTQNDGVLRRNTDNTWEQFIKGIEDVTLYSFCVDLNGGLWLGTDMGLLLASITPSGDVTYEFIEEIIETKVSSIWQSRNELLIGTEDSGIHRIKVRKDGYDITPVHYRDYDLSDVSVNSLFPDKDGNLWICSNNGGLIQLASQKNGEYTKMIRYRDNKQVKTASIRICRTDREGTVWIGTLGDGLLKLTDNHFSVYTYNENKDLTSVNSIFEKHDTIWSGGMSEIFISLEEPVNVIDSLGTKEGLPQAEVTAIYNDESGTLWVGTSTGSLMMMPRGKRKFKSLKIETEIQHQKINDIIGFNNMIYAATDFGIYQFFNEKLISHISIQSGLSHNVVKSLFRDSRGRIWIATNNSQINYIEDGIIKSVPTPEENLQIQIRCIVEDNLGNIWMGTDGSGVLKVTDDKIININKADGLYSDYCYSIICDQRNKLWIGHHGAASRLNILNDQIEIIDPGSGYDIDFNENAVQLSSTGNLFFGINKGLLQYEPQKDQKNDKEPIIHLTKITANDSLYSENYISLPYGEYKIQFDFVGVSLRNPTKVTYQYYLDGYEADWCEPTTLRFKDYSKLGPGEYTFFLKSFNSDGYGGITIHEIKIIIDKPFWLKWWFLTACMLSIILAVRYIILSREKYLREAQERLKVALDERTKEVVEQKELLEEKNKDITDSIQYARNIQRAMLPALDSLKNFFSETFVYYKPRDIVSGDFYWVERFEKTIVVSCADCTGHGVPGAFMSLIGSTLLKDVSSKKYVQCSRDVLTHLDNELSRMLNRQGEMAIEDGMDIVVFDYNVESHIIKIASANRPVLFHHKGEWLDLRGDRQSVGGSRLTEVKTFNQYEFKVEPGDTIYLFSDGITDQFGGPQGKKLKRSGLQNWLKEVEHLSMDEQRGYVKEQFNAWKGDLEQIDDIILIGIKF